MLLLSYNSITTMRTVTCNNAVFLSFNLLTKTDITFSKFTFLKFHITYMIEFFTLLGVSKNLKSTFYN